MNQQLLNPGLAATLDFLVDEAQATKPSSMTLDEAIEILIEERIERGILDQHEASLIRQSRQPSEDEVIDAALAALASGDPQPVLDAAASGILPTDAPVVEEARALIDRPVHCGACSSHIHHASRPVPGCHICGWSFCQCLRPRTWFPTDRACTRGCGLPFAS